MHLKQLNNNNNNIDNDNQPFTLSPRLPLLPFPPLLYPSLIDSDDSDIDGENPIQNFLVKDRPRRDRPQQEKIAVGVRENIAAATPKKVKFSENFSKVFPKADGHFDEKSSHDDDQIDYDERSEISIRNTGTLFKELNNGKVT